MNRSLLVVGLVAAMAAEQFKPGKFVEPRADRVLRQTTTIVLLDLARMLGMARQDSVPYLVVPAADDGYRIFSDTNRNGRFDAEEASVERRIAAAHLGVDVSIPGPFRLGPSDDPTRITLTNEEGTRKVIVLAGGRLGLFDEVVR